MEIIQKTPEKIIFVMDKNYSLANAIRRSVNEIPVLAVDEVEIYKNDSALYDEMLAHRIGLIPLKTEKKMNDKTVVELKLVKKGPGLVYSGDFVGNAEVVYDNIPITLLETGNEIELVATARLGKAVDHAKYNAGLCYYRELLLVKSGNEEIDELIQKAKSPFKPQKQGSFWLCDLDEARVDLISKIDESAIKDSEQIIFFVESYGMIEAKELFMNAIAVLGDNLVEFEKAIA